METRTKDKEAAISARVPVSLKKLMQKFIQMDTHINESDFIRDAIREKIQREAPHLIKELFQPVFEKIVQTEVVVNGRPK